MNPRAASERNLFTFEVPVSADAEHPAAGTPPAKAAQVLAVSSGLLREALRHQENGNTARAGRLLDRVLEQDPRNLRALIHLGGIRRIEGQLYESLLLYQRAIRLDSREAGAHFGLGRTFLDLGWVQTAEAHLRLAIEANPSFVKALVCLSGCLLAQGRRREAVIACQEAIVLAPDCRQAHELLQQALPADDKAVP